VGALRVGRSLVLILLVASLAACATSAPVDPTVVATAVENTSGLPSVRLAELPREASDVVALIDADGPFPFRQDGAVFQNREGILPHQREGYYHEYTVATPGSDDRGARRIVTGADGQMYWTDDHYDSFSWIER
jgi:ribonuclease T1